MRLMNFFNRHVAVTRLAIPAVSIASFVGSATAQSYDVRAKTYDRITATIVDSRGAAARGRVFQGSFGSPSINDKGDVAYSCILGGEGITAFLNNSVVVRLAGEKTPPRLAVQSGLVLDDSFLARSSPSNTFPLPGSAQMYRMSRDVAINNGRKVAFMGNMLFTYYTVDDKGKRTLTDSETATYGFLVPRTKEVKTFRNTNLNTYKNSFFEGIYTRTLSLSAQGTVAFNASFFVTSTKTVEGFAYARSGNQFSSINVISTVDTNVIGLPYFAKFQAFTDAIVANNSNSFVVAQISEGNADFDGIWQGNNPDLQPVVVKTNKAPDGGVFTTFAGTVGPSRSGKYCSFIASTTTGVTGVFRANVDGSQIINVARVGGRSVGAGNAAFSSFTLAATNDVAQVAFFATLSTGKSGIWLSDASGGNLKLVAIEGGTMQIGTTTKTITKLSFNPVSGVNRSGKVAFTASFSDRTSAVIVASL